MGLATQNYDILTRLAVGNGALVYRALDKASHRQVALKLLVQEGNMDHRFDVDSLLASVTELKQITGAHVCQLLDAFTDDDGPVLVYEFANGVNGADLPQQRKLDAAQALDVATQLVSALRSGERQRCPHGDIKPSNIVFIETTDSRPFTVVLDWALTAFRGATADDTLPCLAPERIDGSPASHRADLFSAGATLFYLLTGSLLVGGKERGELLAAWQQAQPAVLGELRPDLPSKFVQWICGLLEIDPAKRPQSAVDALASLTPLGTPPPAIPPESFRARPAAPKTSAPTASAIRQRPSTSTAAPVRTVKPAAPASPKKSRVLVIVGVCIFLAALISGIVWFTCFRGSGKKSPAGSNAEELPAAAASAPARTPAPSVGRDISKPYTPPPLPSTATPAATAPAPPPAPKHAPARRAKPAPAPAPQAPATPPAPAP